MRVEYGPFHRISTDIERNGDCTVIEENGTYILRTSDMSEKDAKLMAATLVAAGYNAKIL